MCVDPAKVPSASELSSQEGQKKGQNRDPHQHQGNWLHCKTKDSRISGEAGRFCRQIRVTHSLVDSLKHKISSVR